MLVLSCSTIITAQNNTSKCVLLKNQTKAINLYNLIILGKEMDIEKWKKQNRKNLKRVNKEGIHTGLLGY